MSTTFYIVSSVFLFILNCITEIQIQDLELKLMNRKFVDSLPIITI